MDAKGFIVGMVGANELRELTVPKDWGSSSNPGRVSAPRRRRCEASSPATPPHQKRARHYPPIRPPTTKSEVVTDDAWGRDEMQSPPSEPKIAFQSLLRRRGLISPEPTPFATLLGLGVAPVILRGVAGFLDCKDIAAFACSSKGLYLHPLLWKTMLMRVLSNAAIFLVGSAKRISWQTSEDLMIPAPHSGGWEELRLKGPVRALANNGNSAASSAVAAYYRRAAKLRWREMAFMPPGEGSTAWLDCNPCLRSRFFPILINWLVDLHLEIFRLHSSRRRSALAPVHVAVKYLYMYLSRVGGCQSQGLQRVGVACYSLAVQRAYPASMLKKLQVDAEKYAYFTDNAYSAAEIASTTAAVASTLPKHILDPPIALEALEEIVAPLSSCSIPREVKSSPLRKVIGDKLIVTHAFYMADLSIHEDAFARDLPSYIAAASLLASIRIVTGVGASDAVAKALSASCCAPVLNLRNLSQRLRRLFERARRRETRQTQPQRAVSASFYWTVIDRYRRKLLSIATSGFAGNASGSKKLPLRGIQWGNT
mmetsp:Transcript_23905/g.46864  ORF Transcript_23905/g.46864 Transcript_23905/m.46864 type:complete len:539 (-) Transcript_23905:199-1815(-)